MMSVVVGPDVDWLHARQKPDVVAVILGQRQTNWCLKDYIKLGQEVVHEIAIGPSWPPSTKCDAHCE
jgi:hypothetical protein